MAEVDVMLIEYKKAVRILRWHSLIPSIFLALGLAACGGGGGGGDGVPTDGGTVGITYTGDTNPASITTTNASTLIDNVIDGSDVTESVPGVQPQAVREPVRWDVVVSAVDKLLLRTRDAAVPASAAESIDYHAAAAVTIEEILPCDSGSMSLSGSLDDQMGTGTVTVTFNACTTDGEMTNGTGTLRVDAMDLFYFEITDGLFSSPLLTITSAEFDVSMSFDMRMEMIIDENLERFTGNLVGRDNRTGDMLKYEDFVEENVYFPFVLNPTSYTQLMRGRLYDSTYGYVDIVTPEVSPLTYSTIEQPYPDTGVLVMTGAGSNLRLVTESTTHVVIALDSDGDGLHEIGVTLLWDEIGEPIAADIGDNDGDSMHNSWETTYGLNPEDATDALLDTDGDGVNNYQEYLDRTHPTAVLDQSFIPSPAAAYQGNIVYRPLDPDYVDQAQTFTVGMTGQLTSVEVLIEGFNQTADLLVDIRPTINGIPVSNDSAILGEVAILGSDIPGFPHTFISADFSSQNIEVTVGSELAIVLKIDRSSPGGDYGWRGETGDLYPSGVAYTRTSTLDWFAPLSEDLTVDYGFKTFVRATR